MGHSFDWMGGEVLCASSQKICYLILWRALALDQMSTSA
ncbi:hypothetical protein BRCON_1205 [Candidatus Sumerlaea chitinivorans]|uniref:Uncharacterized protein n=1 Tax=Sumerlaea chitinivorans TaxID=2250252 RepID=A0A2Z4Y5J9_SUMC1|nr:hypothetical protein BRCON_1205 [Candidatus Sumerlaea chitinivorans]